MRQYAGPLQLRNRAQRGTDRDQSLILGEPAGDDAALCGAGDLGRRLLALVNDIKPEAPKLDRLVVKSGGRVFFLRTDDLDWIEAAGNYVRLHLGEEAHLFRETMTRMEARLDTRRFVRIHRSRIVNTERIKELQPWFNGEYVVVLRNGARLPLSRGYRDKLQEQLGKGF